MAVLTHLLVGDGKALPWNRAGRTVVVSKTIDTAAVNVAQNDVVKLLDIPANTLVERVVASVKTAEGDTLTLHIGDYLKANNAAVDDDGFLVSVNGNAVGVRQSNTIVLTEGTPNTVGPAYQAGKLYTADTAYLGVKFNNAAEAAVIDVHAVLVDCNV